MVLAVGPSCRIFSPTTGYDDRRSVLPARIRLKDVLNHARPRPTRYRGLSAFHGPTPPTGQVTFRLVGIGVNVTFARIHPLG
jgi:hypothetical protein